MLCTCVKLLPPHMHAQWPTQASIWGSGPAESEKKWQVVLKFEVESKGYWNSEKFIKEVEGMIKRVKVKYLKDYNNVFWFFDYSSGYTALGGDDLNENKLNFHSERPSHI